MLATFNHLKGHRNDNLEYKTVIFYPEPDESWHICLVFMLSVLMLMDSVFEDVSTIQEIFHPVVAPSSGHVLRIKKEWQDIPVF
jgi:hypothetical protein